MVDALSEPYPQDYDRCARTRLARTGSGDDAGGKTVERLGYVGNRPLLQLVRLDYLRRTREGLFLCGTVCHYKHVVEAYSLCIQSHVYQRAAVYRNLLCHVACKDVDQCGVGRGLYRVPAIHVCLGTRCGTFNLDIGERKRLARFAVADCSRHLEALRERRARKKEQHQECR